MGELVADYFLKRLREWDVHRVYGYPGDGINAFLGALDRADGDPDFIQARHEEMAAFMACGHAKFARASVGVCMATSGPGAVHLLNGLYDAKLDHPGRRDRRPAEALLARLALSAGDRPAGAVQGCGRVRAGLHGPGAGAPSVDRACRIALDHRAVCTIIVPNDVAELDAVESPPRMHGTVHSSVGYRRPRILPPETTSARGRDPQRGEKVAMLVGAGRPRRVRGARARRRAARRRRRQGAARQGRARRTTFRS